MLNPNAQKWVAALRSGEYKQCKATLKNSTGFCCLGVACEIYPGNLSVDRSPYYLPADVMSWLGLNHQSGFYGETSLSYENDEGKTFAQIADIIESEPEGLFVKEVAQ